MVTLRSATSEDVWLALALETDPVAMAELGGPRDECAVRDVHLRRLDERWWFVICDDGEPVGSIGAWDADHGPEVGWMVLPSHHGRGIASAALSELLTRVRASGAFDRVDAFPGVSNGPSNRLCEKHGFERIGGLDVDFAGRSLRCNHWRLQLR